MYCYISLKAFEIGMAHEEFIDGTMYIITKHRCDDDAINVVCLYFQNGQIAIDSETLSTFLS